MKKNQQDLSHQNYLSVSKKVIRYDYALHCSCRIVFLRYLLRISSFDQKFTIF